MSKTKDAVDLPPIKDKMYCYYVYLFRKKTKEAKESAYKRELETPESLVLKGREARERGLLLNAIQFYDKAIKKDPLNYLPHWEAARCRVTLKKYIDALPNCKALIELKKEWYIGYGLYGQCCYNLNDFHGAYWAFTRGLRYAPSNEYMLRGLSLTQANLRLETEIFKMQDQQKDHYLGKGDKRKTGSHFTSTSADCVCNLLTLACDYCNKFEEKYIFSDGDYLYIYLLYIYYIVIMNEKVQ